MAGEHSGSMISQLNGSSTDKATPTIPAISEPAAPAAPVAPSAPAAPAPVDAPLGTSSGTGNTVPATALTPADITSAVNAAIGPLQKQNADLQTQLTAANSQKTLDKTLTDMNALQLLQSTLSGYNIDPSGSISNAILGMQQNNYDAATIQALIEDPASVKSTDPNVKALATAWNTRFAGNVQRIANGQNPLAPRDYINNENAYRDIIHAAGLPSGFYDNAEHMANLIGNDIAPTELQDRIITASKSIVNQDPFYTSALQQYYGLSPADMIAHALDPNVALPLLQRQAASATFGAAGTRQNVNIDKQTAQQYAALGVTQAQAESGFQSVAQALPTEQKLASIYGGDNTQFGSAGQQQSNLIAATFGGASGASAELQLKKLQQQEVNAFSGSSGVDKNSLFGTTAGQF